MSLLRLLTTVVFTVFLSACGSDAPPNAAAETSAPAPGVSPTPAQSGTADFRATSLAEYPQNYVEGCACELRVDGAEAGEYFFVFQGESDGPGVMGIGGATQIVEPGATLSSGGQRAGFRSYLHESVAYRVQTSLTEEGEDGSQKVMSGRCRITDKRSGEKLEVIVVGKCGC